MVAGRLPSSGTGLRPANDGLLEFIAAINFVPDKIKRLSQQAAAAAVGKVVSAARDNFESSILRPDNRGITDGSRMTGAFTFGSGGAFVGRTFRRRGSQGYGFGFPDVAQADTQTRYVWRSLEHGLQGSSRPESSGETEKRSSPIKGVSTPTSRGLFEYFPRGKHILPSRFIFTDEGAQQSGEVGGFATGNAALIPNKGRKRNRLGSGIEGKHFIEDAWISQFGYIEGKYRRVMDDVAEFIIKA